MKNSTFPIALVIIFALALFAGCNQQEAIPTPPPKKDRLVVYSPHPLSIVRPLLTQFEGETGISVEVIQGGSGELVERLEAEKDAPVCDVLWGGMLSTVGPHMDLFEEGKQMLSVMSSATLSMRHLGARPL